MITEALVLSAMIFVLGTFGVLVRRNAIIMFLCIELQLNAVNLAFIAFSRLMGIDGQVFVFFVMTWRLQRLQLVWQSSSRSFATMRRLMGTLQTPEVVGPMYNVLGLVA
ncbi:MAG: hypothetical protein Ct9H300mP15_15020 [Gemmatimonadota bacterium]|nr:MAG: hypothetical protein Ct9H300mP15_15020 [Gemmatimonadota bacterium]